MNEYFLFCFAIVPVIFLIVSLGALKVPAHKACSITLLITFLLSIFLFKMKITNAITAVLEGSLIALWPIMIVIIAAIFTYNLSLETKSMDKIKMMLSSITSDQRIQVLILAWGFGGFLEAVAGYGTAVAIPASILASLGFNPLFAAVICLIANTVPTAFGAVGIPVITLAQILDLNIFDLSYAVSIQLVLFIIIVPFILVIMTKQSIKGLKGVFFITLMSGLSFAIPQVLVAKYLGAQLPALIGSICSMATTIILAKVFYGKVQVVSNVENIEEEVLEVNGDAVVYTNKISKLNLKESILAWLPYILIFIFIIGSSPLFKTTNEFLTHFKTSIQIYTGEGAKEISFKWISTPGVLIIIATFIGGLIQGAKLNQILKVLLSTIKQLSKSIITVVSIVSMAKLMGYSGMVTSIALILVKITGNYFPIISPMIGALGTFLTGSDTSSNILFGSLQYEVANSININPYWLAAANTSGATAGKMISPQSIAVATSATGLIGSEGKIFNRTIKFCIVYVLFLGFLVFVGSKFINIML
ncbi:MAG: L-lactate permease [Peptostreptococcaceae bacterium]|nr:L-lactate permease [Peptostreptococcaceae bacterium]